MLSLLAVLLCDPSAVSLIGDDLSGWTGSLDDWTVRDGVLIGTTDGSLTANRFIWAEIDPVANFDLTVEVWVSEGGNSGLQYRSEPAPDYGPFALTGYQCDIVANVPKYNGMLYEEKGRRILAHTGEMVVVDEEGQPWIANTMTQPTFSSEQWHTYRIRVVGNHHRHWIDGIPTADVVDLDADGRRLEGLLGMQTHVGPPMEIRFRNLMLTRLPDDLPLQDAVVPSGAMKVAPQGGKRRKPKKTSPK